MFKDIHTFLGLEYRDVSLITFYFVTLVISIPKIRSIGLFNHKKLKINMFKMNAQTFDVFSNDYRVVTFPKSYLTTKGIHMQCLKSKGQF